MDSDGAPSPAKRLTKVTRSFYTALLFATVVLAQPPAGGGGRGGGGRGGGGRGAAANARTSASIEMTGYWVSVVTEDWRFRMVTPPKGSYGGVPVNGEGRRVAGEWDPAKDEAAGLQCKAYGAAGLMRVPGRLHITWDNDTTLKIEADAGTQTRLFHFGGTA